MYLVILALLAVEPNYEWRFPNGEEAALLKDGKQVGSYSFTGKYYRSYDRQADQWGPKVDKPPVGTPPEPSAALVEVNAVRARSGLPPFVEDRGLTVAAQRAAAHRANYLMAGHTANDFSFLPPGTYAQAAGCAAWPPGLGWGSCCTHDRYRYAGAGWAMGRDGRRYMHLYVR